MFKWPKWNMTGKWHGHYAYEIAVQYPDEYPATKFLLVAKQGWFGFFSGTAFDDPDGIGQEEAFVTGSIGFKEVHFRKEYPRLFFWDGTKNISFREMLAQEGLTLDEDIPSYPIQYTGIYDEATDSITGTWIIHREELHFTCSGRDMSWNVEELRGTWTARRLT